MWEASRVYRTKSMSFGLELVTNLRSQPHISCATWAGLPLGMLSSFRVVELEIIVYEGPGTEQAPSK